MRDEAAMAVDVTIGNEEMAYILWVAAEVGCAKAWAAWLEAKGVRRHEAFHVYRAALDREETAARQFEAWSRRAGT
jgi:hypothetical protein